MLDDRIRYLRKSRGITQVQLASELGVTKQCISNWENGNILPSIDMLLRISDYFSVSTDYILGIDDRKYIDATGLRDIQITHICQIISDIIQSN